MFKLGVLLSGGLGFSVLQNLYTKGDVEISCVFTDKKSSDIITYCNERFIPVFIGNPRNEESIKFLNAIGTLDLLFSINYLFIINKDIISYPRLFALNIHGSLLPKYRGRTPHVWAIINGEKETGITIHKIDEGVDTGDILLQESIEINNNDTGASILDKYNEIYPIVIEKALSIVVSGDYSFRKQDKLKATYFGKRTPKDGLINWSWFKERIRNWVRAQAYPYPGAYTIYNDKKIIINKVVYSDFGYTYDIIDGTILSIDPLIVKTPNGALEIVEYEVEGDDDVFLIVKGDVFNQ